jgi:hypothetical protein
VTLQYDREYELIVGDVLIKDFDILFNIEKSLGRKPNTCELTIYNLNPQNRAKLESIGNVVVQLKAGYKGDIGVIFLGDTPNVNNIKEPTDWHTVLSTDDGGKATKFDRINKSYRAGTTLNVVLADVAKSTKIKPGNLIREATKAHVLGNKVFANGVTVSGSALRQLNKLLRSAGMEWSIQDQAFQVLEQGKSLLDVAVWLDPTTGLIGVPSIDKDGDVTVKSNMNSQIIPGRQIVFSSETLSGRMRADKCTYSGDTRGDPWDVKVVGKML